jgi:hypothetical protein
MDVSSGDISGMVFKRLSRNDTGEISLDGRMLSVLMELDGKKNLSAVAKQTGMSMNDLRSIISRLLELNLIEPLENAKPVLDKDFLSYLNSELANAIGPVAEVIIEDSASELGYDLSKFPGNRAAELIDLLAREIQKEDKKNTFKQNMLNKIKEKGY